MKTDWRYIQGVQISTSALEVMRANLWEFSQSFRRGSPCAIFPKNKSEIKIGLRSFSNVIVTEEEVEWVAGADDPNGPPSMPTVKPGVLFSSPFDKY